MPDLKIKKGFEKPQIEFFGNLAILQFAPKPEKPMRDEVMGDYLVAHVDEIDEVIAITITNYACFSRQGGDSRLAFFFGPEQK